jgi:predicted alpha/beta superfamily hydrolase
MYLLFSYFERMKINSKTIFRTHLFSVFIGIFKTKQVFLTKNSRSQTNNKYPLSYLHDLNASNLITFFKGKICVHNTTFVSKEKIQEKESPLQKEKKWYKF